jgi:predicted nucleotidyltransferase
MREYLPRDFVETAEGLFFAVVSHHLDQGRLLAFLRYARDDGSLRKLATEEAHQVLQSDYPRFLYESRQCDVRLHGIPKDCIKRHYSARRRANQILTDSPADELEAKCRRVLELLIDSGVDAKRLGVTGSLAIRAHHAKSDMDLVIYDRHQFFRAREMVRQATARGVLQPLDETLWRETYERRGCGLSFDEYVWHEQRKHNKLVIEGTKADISLIVPDPAPIASVWKKISTVEIEAGVIDDELAFDYPARLTIDHPEISEIASFTHTYTGQARRGERILARGWIERSTTGETRLLVGTSREARDEFVKVLRPSR